MFLLSFKANFLQNRRPKPVAKNLPELILLAFDQAPNSGFWFIAGDFHNGLPFAIAHFLFNNVRFNGNAAIIYNFCV